MKTDEFLNLDISELKGEVIDEIVENFKKGLDNPMLKKVVGMETEPIEN